MKERRHQRNNVGFPERPVAYRMMVRSLIIGSLIAGCLFLRQGSNAQESSVDHSVTSGAVAAQSASTLPPFPHIMYWGVGSDSGWPIVHDPNDVMNTQPSLIAPLDQSVINDLTRAQLVTVAVTPSGDNRPDIVPALRAKNPNIKVFAIAATSLAWCPYGQGVQYTSNMYYRHFFEVAMRWNTDGLPYSECPMTGPGFLFMTKNGVRTVAPGPGNIIYVNYAHRVDNGDGTFTYDVAEAYADLMFQDIYEKHIYDGIIFDWMCMQQSYIVKIFGGYDVDYAYAGYPSIESFDDAWQEGMLRFSARFRQLVVAAGGADFPVVGNCASPHEQFGQLNGWTREDFPDQGGGTWYSNMFNPNIGYLSDDQYFRRPSYSVNLMYPPDLNSIANRRRARFGTASTALGDGYSTVNYYGVYDMPLPPSQPSLRWWMDEYSVDPLTGIATGDGSKIGWLGQPKNDYYQMISANPNPELVPGNGFESDIGTGWKFGAGAPGVATMTRETGVAPQGSSAIHVQVEQLGIADYYIRLSSSNTFAVNPTKEYSITFWAKADHPHTVTLSFDHPGFFGNASMRQPISTEWQRYQVRLKPTRTDAVSELWIMFTNIGDVWLDDIHVQEGITSVYRRDFDNGLVLVNPSESVQTVPLERPYHKILGTISPEINTGESVSSVTLAAAATAGPEVNIGDAVFLLDRDMTAPSNVVDLSAS